MKPAKLDALLCRSRLSAFTEVDAKRKHAFHRDARALLVELARLGELTMVAIQSNKAGPAIGGEVTLDSAELHVQLGAGCPHGVLFRSPPGGPNQWAPWSCLLQPAALVDRMLHGIVKRCACGREFSLEAFEALPYVGRQADEIEAADLRNCPCGSTIAVSVHPEAGQ